MQQPLFIICNDKAFSNGQLGYGCALAVILAIIIFIITALNFAGQDRWVEDHG